MLYAEDGGVMRLTLKRLDGGRVLASLIVQQEQGIATVEELVGNSATEFDDEEAATAWAQAEAGKRGFTSYRRSLNRGAARLRAEGNQGRRRSVSRLMLLARIIGMLGEIIGKQAFRHRRCLIPATCR